MTLPVTYKSDLADCQAFAAKFHQTCTGNTLAANVALLPGETVTCNNTGPFCVDSGERLSDENQDCKFIRKLCVKCEQTNVSDPIIFKVQSNGLPLNCFYGFSQVVEQNIDFDVFWNPAVGAITESDGNVRLINRVTVAEGDEKEFTEQVCSVDNKTNANGNGFNPKAGSNQMDGAIGISLDGVLLFPNLEQASPLDTSIYTDVWYPDWSGSNKSVFDPAQFTIEDVDTCFGSVSANGEYRYRAATDCITQKNARSGERACGSACQGKMAEQIATQNLPLVGIAKDGRVIYGPQRSEFDKDYKTISTRTWNACELDVCNGIRDSAVPQAQGVTGSNKLYSYRASTYHPYLVGCFGPGSVHDLGLAGQYCSSNKKACGAYQNLLPGLASLLAISTSLVLLLS